MPIACGDPSTKRIWKNRKNTGKRIAANLKMVNEMHAIYSFPIQCVENAKQIKNKECNFIISCMRLQSYKLYSSFIVIVDVWSIRDWEQIRSAISEILKASPEPSGVHELMQQKNVARGFAIIAPRIKINAKLQTLATIETTKDAD